MADPSEFFKDVFECYPSGWQVYEQKALKFAIWYENKTGQPRTMLEIRSGENGKTELKNGKPPVWEAGEGRWIAIEPSNRTFYYKDNHYGAAAYPKKKEDAKHQWVAMKTVDILSIRELLQQKQLSVPFYQIADTLKSLYQMNEDIFDIIKTLKRHWKLGSSNMGFPGKLQLFQSPLRALGHPVSSSLVRLQPFFPMSYRKVPMVKGALIVLDLDKLTLKKGPIRYTHMDFNTDRLVEVSGAMARIIDQPQVKGALWVPLNIKINGSKLLAEAKECLTNSNSYRLV